MEYGCVQNTTHTKHKKKLSELHKKMRDTVTIPGLERKIMTCVSTILGGVQNVDMYVKKLKTFPIGNKTYHALEVFEQFHVYEQNGEYVKLIYSIPPWVKKYFEMLVKVEEKLPYCPKQQSVGGIDLVHKTARFVYMKAYPIAFDMHGRWVEYHIPPHEWRKQFETATKGVSLDTTTLPQTRRSYEDILAGAKLKYTSDKEAKYKLPKATRDVFEPFPPNRFWGNLSTLFIKEDTIKLRKYTKRARIFQCFSTSFYICPCFS